MRDLYFRLNVDKASDLETIRAAIKSCKNASIKNDATEILLVAARRKKYDKVHGLLKDLALLRANLGINNGSCFQAIDFKETNTEFESRYEILFEKIKTEQNKHKLSQRNKIQSKRRYKFFSVAIITITIVASIIATLKNEDVQPKPNLEIFERHADTRQELPLPETGTINRYLKDEFIAPLKIETNAGTNYFIKIQDARTRKVILDLFIRGGDTVQIEMPLGEYTFKYATGRKWYGNKLYFGKETSYSSAENTFKFEKVGRDINGFTISLFQVENGNLKTKDLNAKDF